jgi:hypothetical protein
MKDKSPSATCLTRSRENRHSWIYLAFEGSSFCIWTLSFPLLSRKSLSARFTSFKKQEPGYCFFAVAGPFFRVPRTEASVRFGS